MSKELIERLREHAATLASERELHRDDADAQPAPNALEHDIIAAAHAIEAAMENQRERLLSNTLLESTVNELVRYQRWAKEVRNTMSALLTFPNGEA